MISLMRIRTNPSAIKSGLKGSHQISVFRGHASHEGDSCAHNADSFVRASNNGKEYAFEMVNSTVRFGVNVTQEIGQDLQNMNAQRTLLITDTNVAGTRAFDATVASLNKYGIKHTVFDGVKVEPTDTSVNACIQASIDGNYDSFIAVGGGSVMDTAKCAALFVNNPNNDLYDFASAPLGREEQPSHPMRTLIAVPTTAGTGSETTSTAIFDNDKQRVKSGIRNRKIKPHLAIIDPLNVKSMPREVAIYSGFDILCHAAESFTARPFYDRKETSNPAVRPVYQGSNPISDVWCRQALYILRNYFLRSIADPTDLEAQGNMMLAACYGGMGFGNAGTHLPHGLSYALSGQTQVREFQSDGYKNKAAKSAMIPHGLSVVLTAPAVFEFTGAGCPERHSEALRLLVGNDVKLPKKQKDIGMAMGDHFRYLMDHFKVPNGLKAVNFNQEGDLSMLSKLAMLSQSALNLSPIRPTENDLFKIYERSQKVY